MMNSILINNTDKIHTTKLGDERIRRNLSLGDEDTVKWCLSKITDKNAVIERRGKNWYVESDGCVITVNAGSFTIITAHKA